MLHSVTGMWLCLKTMGISYGWRGASQGCAVPRKPLNLPAVSSVCSSPPIHMKVQPLNQTALQVSWSQPETIYHPPIMNYMISYSWTKNEDKKEKTFMKHSDKDLVSPVPRQGAACPFVSTALAVPLGQVVCLCWPILMVHVGTGCHGAW